MSRRFTAMCVPGELNDGADADWYVFALLFRTSDKVGTGPQARSLAAMRSDVLASVAAEDEAAPPLFVGPR